ncbi:MAG: PTS sugar transporter subunit IIA [Desulfuromonadales bacterium]|nr:PTS sugar transporter subunit IIA [Desulfuromonadales bacterium]MDT8423816.1 PTS sugar transporter subunit IIA [Desulfuromonadales bacterium]
MKIVDLLHPETIISSLQARTKDDVLAELAEALFTFDESLDRTEVIKVLHERERLGSTGIGDGVAIPHGKLKSLDKLLIAFARSIDGVDFDAMDGKPAHLFFLLVAPEESVGVHLKMLARISKILKNKATREQLVQAPDAQALYKIIADEEERF